MLGVRLQNKKEFIVNTTALLEKYEQFNYVIEQMLINARNNDWELLLSWQPKYVQLAKRIMFNEDLTEIDKIPQQHQDMVKMYVKNIFSYQQQLTQLVITRHTQLKELIGEQVDYQNKISRYQEIASLI